MRAYLRIPALKNPLVCRVSTLLGATRSYEFLRLTIYLGVSLEYVIVAFLFFKTL